MHLGGFQLVQGAGQQLHQLARTPLALHHRTLHQLVQRAGQQLHQLAQPWRLKKSPWWKRQNPPQAPQPKQRRQVARAQLLGRARQATSGSWMLHHLGITWLAVKSPLRTFSGRNNRSKARNLGVIGRTMARHHVLPHSLMHAVQQSDP